MMAQDLFSGRTLEDALQAAAQHLGVAPQSIGYEVINKPSGFFGKWFSSSVRIRVWLSDESSLKEAARNAVVHALCHEPTAPSSPPYQKSASSPNRSQGYVPPLPYAAPGALAIPKPLEELFSHFEKAFSLPRGSVGYKWRGDVIEVVLSSPGIKKVLSKSEKLPMSLEHLAQRFSQKFQWPFKVVFDFGEGYLTQEQRLEDLAKSASQRVMKSGQPVSLSLSSSYERRLVHKTVASIPGVESRSSGMGQNRRLVIYLKGAPPSSRDIMEESQF